MLTNLKTGVTKLTSILVDSKKMLFEEFDYAQQTTSLTARIAQLEQSLAEVKQVCIFPLWAQ